MSRTLTFAAAIPVMWLFFSGCSDTARAEAPKDGRQDTVTSPGTGIVSVEAGSITLGPKDNAVIVHGKAPAAPELLAAQELQRFIRLMTRIEVPIRDDSAREGGLILSVGRTRYAQPGSVTFDSKIAGPGEDSFLLNVQPGRITMLGGGLRGTLYSVYALLEEQGCRWFMPGSIGQVVPRKDVLIFPVGQRFESPDFILREICSTEAGNAGKSRDIIDWCVRNRINRNYDTIDHNEQYWGFRGGWPRCDDLQPLVLPDDANIRVNNPLGSDVCQESRSGRAPRQGFDQIRAGEHCLSPLNQFDIRRLRSAFPPCRCRGWVKGPSPNRRIRPCFGRPSVLGSPRIPKPKLI